MQTSAVMDCETTRVIQLETEAFRENFNKRWFPLEHALAHHPLFDLDRLIALAKQTAAERPHHLHFDKGATSVGQRWSETPVCDLPVDETIRRIEQEGAWIVLKHAELDRDYKVILERTMAEVHELAGPQLRKQVSFEEVILFITSPNRLTTYHIDRECNFIAQVRGDKTIYIFDREDREVLPEPEIERFWAVDNNAAVYKKELQHHADSFVLRPGNGVHLPVNAPHWLQNHDNISVTASLNFKFNDSRLANIYRANYALRKLGLDPMPPGKSPARDSVKRSVVTAAMALANATPNGMRDGFKRMFS
jgi:hypothetical protein